MRELRLNEDLSRKLGDLYAEMETVYDQAAAAVSFSCRECPDNCCDSYFLHHTHIEWAYLWEGLRLLPEEQRHILADRAAEVVRATEHALALGKRPQVMCPLNEAGLCSLYQHRLMICRLHGVAAAISSPDGRSARFPGCFRFQDVVAGLGEEPAPMDRTPFFQRMVTLELQLLGNRPGRVPRIKKTIAQMILQGPPGLP